VCTITQVATFDDSPATVDRTQIFTATLHDPAVYCLPDTVDLGAANAGLDATYLFYFETNPNLLTLNPAATNGNLALDGCPLIFSLSQAGWGGTGDFDSAIFSIDAATGVIQIATTDEASYDLDTYTMTVTIQSSLSNVGGGSKTAAFDITFKSHCWDATITAPAFAATYPIMYTKDIWESFSLPFTPGTSSLDCGTITYKLFLASNDAEETRAALSVAVNVGPPITTSLAVDGA